MATSYLTNSHRYSVRAFDHEGRETFAAYPTASVGTVSAVVASGVGVSKQYDALGRLQKSIAYSERVPVLLETVVKYLPGNRKQIKNPRGQITEIDYLQYDAPSEDSPTQIQQYPDLNTPSPLATTQIVRDAWGKPKSITRSGTNPVVSATRSYVYDAYQRLCKTIEPERAAEIFHYDAASRIDWSAKGQALTSTTSCQDTSVAAAARIAREYDPRDRLRTVNYPDATLDESRTYYADGALQTLTRGPGTANEMRWEYQYNRRRLMTEARAHFGGQSAAMNWNYDAIGNVAGEYALNGVWTTYSPNAFGQPTLVKDPDAGRVYASSISWFPNGALAGFTYGNGVVHTLTKNARDLPWRSRDLNGGATIIDHTYTYDENGNPTGIDDVLNLDDKALGYDLLDRLTSASGGFGTATLAYDALDNITRYSMPGRDWYYDMSSNQRLLQTRNASNTPQVVLGYDGRGNVTSRRDLRSAQGFTYDLADRVLTATRDGVLQATHVYDGNGLRTRTSKPAPGAPQPDRDLRFQIYTPSGVFQWENDIECSQLRSRGVNYVRLAGSLVAKVVANSTLTQAECYPGTSNSEQQVLSLNPFRNPFTGATEVVAGNDGGRDGEAPSAPTSTTYSIVYVHTDALGSPVAETSTNGTVISGSRTQYEPYGKPLTPTREGAPSYTGHQYDTSTGLIYAQQRYYDPALGRFLSTDPMAVDMGAAGNWNRYAYAANNPYRFTDPDGRAPGAGARYIGDGMVGVDARMIGEMTNVGGRGQGPSSDGPATLRRGKSRPLAAGEISMAEEVFFDDIDYSSVKVYRRTYFPGRPRGEATSPNGNIYFHPDDYLDDFSKARMGTRAWFMHEMTHVWQKQQGINVILRRAFDGNYNYLPLAPVPPGRPFSSFGIEQQGDIVRDYYLLRHGYQVEGAPSVSTYQSLLPFREW